MREIRVRYGGVAAIAVIGGVSYAISAKVVRKGERAVHFEMVHMRARSAFADTTPEELTTAAKMIIELPGVDAWAWSCP